MWCCCNGGGRCVWGHLFDAVEPAPVETDSEDEASEPIFPATQQLAAARDSEWYLPSGQTIYLEIGDVNPASRTRSAHTAQRIIRMAKCSHCGAQFTNHRHGKDHMRQAHGAVKRMAEVFPGGAGHAPPPPRRPRDIFQTFGIPSPTGMARPAGPMRPAPAANAPGPEAGAAEMRPIPPVERLRRSK
jgi:hypothetical protein